MEEEQLFEEMKPLLKDYVEFTKEDMSEKWENMEKEALAKVEESQARRDEARNKEEEARKKGETLRRAKRNLKSMVAIIGDEEYKSIEGKINQNVEEMKELGREYNHRYRELKQAQEEQQQTKATIEKEKQERLEQQKEKQGNIYEKTQGYIDSKKEEMSQDIQEKSKRLEEVKTRRSEIALEAKNAHRLRLTIRESSENIQKSATYKVLSEKASEELQKIQRVYKESYKEIKRAEEELEGAKATLASFEEKYDAIDFTSEAGIQSLIELTGWEEQKEGSVLEESSKDTKTIEDSQESETEVKEEIKEESKEEPKNETTKVEKDEEEQIHKLTDEEAEIVKPNEAKKDTQEEKEKEYNKTKQQKWDEIEGVFKEIEDGYEDLLPRGYLEEKYRTLGMKNVDKAMEKALIIKGKSLLDICEQAYNVEDNLIEKAVLENSIVEIKERNRFFEGATEEQKEQLKESLKRRAIYNATFVAFHHMQYPYLDLLTPLYNGREEYVKDEIASKDYDEATKILVKIFNMRFSDFLKEQIEEVKANGENTASLEELLEEVTKRENERWKERNKDKKQPDPNLNQAGQPKKKEAEKSPKGEESPKGTQPPKGEQPPKGTQLAPTQAGKNQILESEQQSKELPITRIEVNTNKGKVIVVYADSKKENKEYLIRDMLYDRRNYRGAIKDKIGEDILKRYDTKRDERNIKVC